MERGGKKSSGLAHLPPTSQFPPLPLGGWWKERKQNSLLVIPSSRTIVLFHMIAEQLIENCMPISTSAWFCIFTLWPNKPIWILSLPLPSCFWWLIKVWLSLEKMASASGLVSTGQPELFAGDFWAHPGPDFQNSVLCSTPLAPWPE